MEHRALLFGPGQAAAGTPVAARFDALQLSWSASGGPRRTCRYTLLRVARAGHNDACLGFSWVEDGHAWSMMIVDPADCGRLLAAPPAGLAAPLAGLRRQSARAARRKALGVSALALWLALPVLLVLGLLLAAGPIASRATGLVSIEREQALGAALFRSQAARLDLLEGTPANAAVEEIGRRLTAGSAYTYRWHVARDASINAFAMPGGYIVVHTGLIDTAGSPEELAGVLAHEVQHVEQRHSLQQMARGLGLQAGIALLLGDVGTLGSIATGLSDLKFSRDHEREADLRGLESLRRAGIDPAGMVSMFRKLESAAAGRNPPAILSSHPATSERIASIQDAIGTPPGSAAPRPLPVDWQAVQRSLGGA